MNARNVVRRVTITLAALLLAAQAVRADDSDSRADRACRPDFGNACSEALGRWLPHVSGSLSRNDPAFATTVRDALIDPNHPRNVDAGFLEGSVAGTFFVHGVSGPPRGHVAYDRVNRIALYDEGCCSWHHTVLAARVGPPPKAVSERPLVAVHTKTGIRLGDSPDRIRTIYGPASLRANAERPLESLSYVKKITLANTTLPCESTTFFLFRNDALTAIDMSDAC